MSSPHQPAQSARIQFAFDPSASASSGHGRLCDALAGTAAADPAKQDHECHLEAPRTPFDDASACPSCAPAPSNPGGSRSQAVPSGFSTPHPSRTLEGRPFASGGPADNTLDGLSATTAESSAAAIGAGNNQVGTAAAWTTPGITTARGHQAMPQDADQMPPVVRDGPGALWDRADALRWAVAGGLACTGLVTALDWLWVELPDQPWLLRWTRMAADHPWRTGFAGGALCLVLWPRALWFRTPASPGKEAGYDASCRSEKQRHSNRTNNFLQTA
jgi:hypothetical protein